jgi:hypothetical protein
MESIEGRTFSVSDINAQYVRVWCGEDNKGGNPVFVEVELYETCYSLDPKSIKTKEIITSNVLTSLTATTTLHGGSVTYNIVVDDIYYWWDGVTWLTVETPDFYKSNTLADITSNWMLFVETYSPRYFQFVVWLYSAIDGSDTPEISKLDFIFDLDPSVVPTPAKRLVYGYIYCADGSPKQGVIVTAELIGVPRVNPRYDDHSGNAAFVSCCETRSITNQYGYFAFPLIINTRFESANAKWRIVSADGIQKTIIVDDSSMVPINLGTL